MQELSKVLECGELNLAEVSLLGGFERRPQ